MTEMTNAAGHVPVFDEADRLGKALQWSGVKVQEMADELGVSRNTVGNYLSRRRRVPRAVKIVWALKTGVPLQWLETGNALEPDGPEGGERACRDSNPKPSDLYSDAPRERQADVVELPTRKRLAVAA